MDDASFRSLYLAVYPPVQAQWLLISLGIGFAMVDTFNPPGDGEQAGLKYGISRHHRSRDSDSARTDVAREKNQGQRQVFRELDGSAKRGLKFLKSIAKKARLTRAHGASRSGGCDGNGASRG